MSMMVRSVLAALLLMTACGGQSERDDPDASGGKGGAGAGGSDSTGGTGGSGATGGSGSVGGTGSRLAECDPNVLQQTCVADCGEEEYSTTGSVCADGEWVCPTGATLLEDCPEHACRRDPGLCCDTSIGVTSAMACEDGTRLACPSLLQSIQPGDGCMPEGVTDCTTLDKKTCGSVVEECQNPGRCSTSCRCELQTDGVTLRWSCWTLLC
jgi:hypothetical protein